MKTKRLLPGAIAGILAILIFLFIHSSIIYEPKNDYAYLAKGWDVKINSESFSDVDITHFYEILDSKLVHGDVITMSITLPDLGDIPFPVILFKSRYTTLECFLDDEPFYDSCLDLYRNKSFIGKLYHFIPLPYGYEGKTFTVKMIVGENNAFHNLDPMQLGSEPDIKGMLVNSNISIISTGIFLFLFGLFFLSISLLFVTTIPDIRIQIVSSLFCINLGAWLLSYYNMLAFFYNTRMETQIEYITMYLIVPFCYVILYHIQSIEKKRLFMTAFIISILVPAFQFILHFVFSIHLRVTVVLYHLVAIFGYCILIYYYNKSRTKKDLSPSTMIQMSGLFVFTTTEIMHVVIYHLGSGNIYVPDNIAKEFIIFGSIFFAICQLAYYLVYITQTYAQRREFASLSHLAYADGLTNLPNRAKADKYLKELDNASTDYCIISIDLNGLKPVNDKYGHLTGDKYIKDFSKVLTNNFESHGMCARIGGDEFLIIINDASNLEIDSMIERMNSALNVMNALYPEYTRSVAAGYAYKYECPDGGSHEVYLLADERMYANKKIMHEKLGISARI